MSSNCLLAFTLFADALHHCCIVCVCAQSLLLLLLLLFTCCVASAVERCFGRVLPISGRVMWVNYFACNHV